MALPAVPFILGVLAGSALTYYYRSKAVQDRLHGFGLQNRRRKVFVDAEPVEDTVGLEARFRA